MNQNREICQNEVWKELCQRSFKVIATELVYGKKDVNNFKKLQGRKNIEKCVKNLSFIFKSNKSLQQGGSTIRNVKE